MAINKKLYDNLRIRFEYPGVYFSTINRPSFDMFKEPRDLDLHGLICLFEHEYLFDRPILPLSSLPSELYDLPFKLLTPMPQPPYSVIGFMLSAGDWVPRSRFSVNMKHEPIRRVWDEYYNKDEHCWNAGLSVFLSRANRDGVTPLFMLAEDGLSLLAARNSNGSYIDYTDVATKYFIPCEEIMAVETDIYTIADVLEKEPGIVGFRAIITHPELGDIPVCIQTETHANIRKSYQIQHPHPLIKASLTMDTFYVDDPEYMEMWAKLRLHYLTTCQKIEDMCQTMNDHHLPEQDVFEALSEHKLVRAILKKYRNPQLSIYDLVKSDIFKLTRKIRDAEDYVASAISAEVD